MNAIKMIRNVGAPRAPRTHRLAVAAIASVLAVAAARPAAAVADAPSCTIFEVAASRGATPRVAPELAPIEGKLKRPPLSSWNVFALLTKTTATFGLMESKTVKLKRATANIVLREVTAQASKRYSFSVAVDDEKGRRVVDTKYSIDAGDYVVIGRSVDGDAGHLIAIGGCQ